MSRQRLLLGIDVGTSGARAILIDDDGAVLRSTAGEYPLHAPRPGWTEQDPDDWVRVVARCIEDIAAPAGTPIGFTGQMHGSVFLDERDQVIRPALLWNDQRTASECAQIEQIVGAETVRRLTGNPALTSFQLPKLLWLRGHEPQHAARVRAVLLPKDYVRWRVTGERCTDVADASGTGVFDIAQRAWSHTMLQQLEIDPALFPPVGESVATAGAGDQAAGAVGTGAVRDGIVSVSLGTSGVVFASLQQLPHERDDAVNLFCHATGGWHAMTVMLSAGGALRWLRETIYQNDASYAEIMNEAASADGTREDLVFLPYLAGERSPHNDPAARGAWVGVSLHHRRAHLARAVVEGVTFGLLDGLRALERMTGMTPREVRVTGGGARSPFWRQLLADVFGVPVVTLTCDEGPAFGAAILAGVRAGVWRTVEDACDVVVKTADRTEPAADRADSAYAAAYDRFQALYPLLRSAPRGNG